MEKLAQQRYQFCCGTGFSDSETPKPVPVRTGTVVAKSVSTDFDERIVPDETEKGIVSAHLKRYVFAGEFCRAKQVLDIACGVGYGTHYLADLADYVTGIDQSEEAIAYARNRYAHPRVSFAVMDACRLTFQNQMFDVVCSFETIEHLRDVRTYLDEIRRVLKSDGLFVVSTPCVKRTTASPENPFHVQEWSPQDFETLLSEHFTTVRLFGQKRKQTALHRLLQKVDILNLRAKVRIPALTKALGHAVGTIPFVHMDLDDLEIVEGDLKDAIWTLAVCSRPR